MRALVILACLILAGGMPFVAFANQIGDAEAGELVFKKCKSCHQVGTGAKDRTART